MTAPTIALLAALAFLVPGIMCFLWPNKIQEFALRYYTVHPLLARLNPFLEWMKTRNYIVHLRICGVLSINAAGLILFAMMRGIEK